MIRILSGSLTSRLIATVVVLVAAVGILVAVLTTLAVRGTLMDRLDQDVRGSVARALRPMSSATRPTGPPPTDVDPRVVQGPRTLTAFFAATAADGQVTTAGGDRRQLSTRALDRLAEVPVGQDPATVRLPGLGEYRVAAHLVATTTGGQRVVVVGGLPTDSVDSVVNDLVRAEVLLILFAVGTAGLLGAMLVGGQLRPLRSVASTAHEVAALPLATGEVGVTARVPAELSDEQSEVGRVGAALNTLLGHVETALDARHRSEQQVRRFVADASHELRTPLATIQGYAELAERTGGDRDRVLEALGKVRGETVRMTALVEDLLLLARLDAGRPLAVGEVDLSRMLLESVADARVVAGDHAWILDLPERPVTTTGDPQRLHQVVGNLLSNAWRHTPAGTAVTVGLRVLGPEHGNEHGTGGERRVEVLVHDDGPGVPEDLRAAVFERFTRADAARTRAAGGAGLGLSLARAIARAHDGDLTLSSAPGATTFRLVLPQRP